MGSHQPLPYLLRDAGPVTLPQQPQLPLYEGDKDVSPQTHQDPCLKSSVREPEAAATSQLCLPPPLPAGVLPAAPRTPTFQMLASFPYTTAMLLTLLDLMNCLSVLLSSSDTKPMKELSGV